MRTERWNSFSATNPSRSEGKLAYFKLNSQTPCPPRGAVPVNQGRGLEFFTQHDRIAFGNGCDYPNYDGRSVWARELGRKLESAVADRFDADGKLVEKSFSRDENGHLVETRNGSNQVTATFTYAASGNLTASSNANQVIRNFTYDANGNQTRAITSGHLQAAARPLGWTNPVCMTPPAGSP